MKAEVSQTMLDRWSKFNTPFFKPTWEEEIEYAESKGFELVCDQDLLDSQDRLFVMRKSGVDTLNREFTPFYPIYRRQWKFKDRLRGIRPPYDDLQYLTDLELIQMVAESHNWTNVSSGWISGHGQVLVGCPPTGSSTEIITSGLDGFRNHRISFAPSTKLVVKKWHQQNRPNHKISWTHFGKGREQLISYLAYFWSVL